MKTGVFIVSLDFEKIWGVIDLPNYENFIRSVKGVDTVLPKIIELSDKYFIKLTIAIVGLLMCRNKSDIEKYSPLLIPSYLNQKLNPYGSYINDNVGDSDSVDRLHYAHDLLKQIHHPHEIASHTFCHYYCNAPGQTKEEFEADLNAASLIAKAYGIDLKSIIFPRNECRDSYLEVCENCGFRFYRGNENNWLHKATPNVPRFITMIKRACRLLDTYVPLTGHNCYDLSNLREGGMLNISASRFLRGHSPTMKVLDHLKLKRICRDMTYAARNGLVYHLWWHPHNFGSYQEENIAFLEKIYKHYQKLHNLYGFESLTFSQLGERYYDK